MAKHLYEVVVQNIGTVYSGSNKAAATKDFNMFVRKSKRNYGRAAGSCVDFYEDGDVTRQYHGSLDDENETEPTNIHQHIKEKCELAMVYAEDGAFYSAAKVLKQLAQSVKQHADECLKQETQTELLR